MGLRRKNRIHEERGKGPTMQERLAMAMDETNSINAAKTRLKFQEHWMEVCNVDSPDQIDYDNPIVHLEWFLCEPKMLAKLTAKEPEIRQEVIDLMDDSQR